MGIFSKFFRKEKKKEYAWKKVWVNKELKFKGYTKKDVEKLQRILGKRVFIRKISNLFYITKEENAIIFFADFREKK